jgi:hypothetical protein
MWRRVGLKVVCGGMDRVRGEEYYYYVIGLPGCLLRGGGVLLTMIRIGYVLWDMMDCKLQSFAAKE